MKTSELIKEARKNKGYTQDFVAAEIGKTKNYISLIEGGKKSPSLKILRKMSVLLDVPYLLLIKEKIDMPKPKNKEEEKIIKDLDLLYKRFENLHRG